MRYALILSLLLAVPCLAQTTKTGGAKTTGPCSPAVSGSQNIFQINCGIDKQQGQKMIDILNKILANQLDPAAVMAKLDEILKAVNPNIPVKVYSCDGEWQTHGPAASAMFAIQSGGDRSAYLEMVNLYNSGQYTTVLKQCLDEIRSTPEWLTPRLFCGLAYLSLGNKDKAKAMLKEFDGKAGPGYTSDGCGQMADYLHKQLP